jgi:hypothetical protein
MAGDRRKIFIIVHELGAAGRAGAILDQCRMFLDLGLTPVIVTFKYEPDYDQRIRERRGANAIPEGAETLNIHKDLAGRLTRDPNADWSRSEDEDVAGLTVSETRSGDKADFHYLDRRGRLVKHRETASGATVKTTYYSHGSPHLVRDYDERGFCGRETTLDIATGATLEERFFTPDGYCYATRHMKATTGKQDGAYQHNPFDGTSLRYGHNTPWHSAWLNEVLSSTSPKPLAIAEQPSSMLKLLATDKNASDKLYMCHANVFNAPYVVGSGLRSDYGPPLKRIEEMPAVVVLTEKQKADFRATFGETGNVVVIPNVMRDKSGVTDPEKASGRIGVASRLVAEQKRLDDLLHIWKIVAEAVPHAHLDICGGGPDRQNLEALTRELGIESRVTFRGWVKNGAEFMASCIATVNTSRHEGLPLSIGESLASGTPVVAYDINYGPSDLIRDGVDGYVVPDSDRAAFAEALIRLLTDEDAAKRMGEEGARRMSSEFSASSISRRWESAFKLAARRS